MLLPLPADALALPMDAAIASNASKAPDQQSAEDGGINIAVFQRLSPLARMCFAALPHMGVERQCGRNETTGI